MTEAGQICHQGLPHPTRSPNIEMLITELEPMGERAFETGSYRGVHLIDGQTIPDRGKYMRIWKLEQDGNWKIFREMFNDSSL